MANVELTGEILAQVGGIGMVTTTVSTNVGTKQALLPAVPVGKVRVITQITARNASATLADMGDLAVIGFNAGADDVGSLPSQLFALLTSSTKSASWATSFPNGQDIILYPGGLQSQTLGAGGDVLGIVFYDPSITATVDIDTFYYDVPA